MKLRKWSLSVAAVLGFSANVHALANDVLEGTWEMKCASLHDEDDFISGKLTFKDGSVTTDLTFYDDAACTKESDSLKSTGTYVIGGSHGDGQKLDMTETQGPTSYGAFKLDGNKLSFTDFEETDAKRPTTYVIHFDKVTQ